MNIYLTHMFAIAIVVLMEEIFLLKVVELLFLSINLTDFPMLVLRYLIAFIEVKKKIKNKRKKKNMQSKTIN